MNKLYTYRYNIFGAFLLLIGCIGIAVAVYLFFLAPPDPYIQEYASQQAELKTRLLAPIAHQSSFIANFKYDVDTVQGVECTPKHFQSTKIEAISANTARVTGIATSESGGTIGMPRKTTYDERTYEVKKYGDTFRAELDVVGYGDGGTQCHIVVTLTSQNVPE